MYVPPLDLSSPRCRSVVESVSLTSFLPLSLRYSNIQGRGSPEGREHCRWSWTLKILVLDFFLSGARCSPSLSGVLLHRAHLFALFPVLVLVGSLSLFLSHSLQ